MSSFLGGGGGGGGGGRAVLTADTTFYVSTTGSDITGDGSNGNPWLTLQHAIDVISTTIDTATLNVILNIGAGSFVGFGLTAMVGGGCLQIYGAGSGSTTITQNPSLFVTIQLGLITPNAGAAPSGSPFAINGVTLTGAVGNDVIAVQGIGQSLVLGDNLGSAATDIIFSGVRNRSISLYNEGNLIVLPGSVTFAGAGLTIENEIALFSGSQAVPVNAAFTITGTPTYSGSCVMLRTTSVWDNAIKGGGSTFSGSVTGVPYLIDHGSNAIGSAFPGNTAGAIDSTSGIDLGNGPNVFTVATLPSATTVATASGDTVFAIGARAIVTDSKVNVPGAEITVGGGPNIVFSCCDGTNWLVLGSATVAVSNLTFYVSTTGSDSNPGTSGSPFLTIQHALNVAAQYNYQNLYSPTINLADGTYNTQVTLPLLINCPDGGSIVGNTTTWTNVVVNDLGTVACFTTAPQAMWFVQGMRVGGTFGAFSIPTSTYGEISIDKIDFHGAGTALYMGPASQGSISLFGGTFTVSSTAMNYFIQSNGFITPNSATLTFSNAITFAQSFIWLDDPYGFIAGFGFAMVNGSNVTSTGPCLHLSSGAYFEGGANTTVDGAPLTRANIPGHASGFTIDGTSVFKPDLINSGNLILGTYAPSAALTGAIVIADGAGTLRIDYGVTAANALTFHSVGNVTFDAPQLKLGGTAPGLVLNDTETNGHIWELQATLNGTTSYVVLADITANSFAGIDPIAWNYDGLYSTQILSGGVFGWSSNSAYADGAAMDTGLSRTAAGVVAVGNGSPANASGTLNAAAYQVGGTPGISGTITTAKITPVSGANGSMTFVNGILTAQTQAT